MEKGLLMKFRTYHVGIRSNCAWLLALMTLPAAIADQGVSISPTEPDADVVYSDVSDLGMVFIDGVYIEAPYTVSATKTGVFINQVPINFTIDPDPDGDFEGGRQSEHRASGGAGRRGPGFGRTDHPRDTNATSKRGPERPTQRQAPPRQAERLWQTLSDESSILLIFTGHPILHVSAGDMTYCLCSNFLQPEQSEELQLRVVRAVSNVNMRTKVQEWMNNYQPPADLLAKMQLQVDQIDAVEHEGRRRSEAIMRMDTMAYPLTLIAMMLGVIALGHMLKWTAHSIVSNQDGGISIESIRGAEIALLLMGGMSAVDLVWTILASQAGIMREVNPLAAGIIDSPMALAVFKVLATSLGFGLLYVLRTQKRGQEVTWWMCLVCVLVTFRWVMFDSMT